jgi:hypothetical protein
MESGKFILSVLITVIMFGTFVTAAPRLIVTDRSSGQKLGCFVRAAKNNLKAREGTVHIYFGCKEGKVWIRHTASSGYNKFSYVQNWSKWQARTKHCGNPCSY